MDFSNHLKNKFSFVSQEDLKQLMTISQEYQFKKGDKIIDFGEKKKKVIIILEGIVRGYIVNYQGKELTTFIYQENAAFAAYEPFLLSKPSNHAFECLEPTKVLIIDHKDLDYLISKNTHLKQIKDKIIIEGLLLSFKRNESFIKLSPEKRYKNFINKQSGLLQRVPQKHLASYLGITAVSFSRLKKRIYKQHEN